ncbi:gluconolactonase [Vibrio maritimus]|uniref:Gluconolactonase n=1 Tax=Vibrio maritimus TaxID=990268 RepID=A0A090S3E5_9VIBR|nr:gluconolactonase [Vibrio maritimus]
MMSFKVLDAPASDLGEGIFLDKNSMVLYWVDINNNNLFKYDILTNKLLSKIEVPNNPSCIISVQEDRVTYTDSESVSTICSRTGKISRLFDHIGHDPVNFRANDGVALSDGCMIYGTMSFHPELIAGKIYVLEKNKTLKAHDLGIHIPNTFISSNEHIYVSDSLKKCTYVVNVEENNVIDENSLRIWKNFSNCSYTPDGGCISSKGYLHIALWDGASIGVFDQNGKNMKKIHLPVLKPTNCIISENRWLYVTSAKEGMTQKQLNKYPLSGKTLVVDLGDDYEY